MRTWLFIAMSFCALNSKLATHNMVTNFYPQWSQWSEPVRQFGGWDEDIIWTHNRTSKNGFAEMRVILRTPKKETKQ